METLNAMRVAAGMFLYCSQVLNIVWTIDADLITE